MTGWAIIRSSAEITLVGFDDTIALINGIMPDATSSVLLKGNRFDISLYNFSGTAYVKYEYGQYTMGQMKSKGKMIAEDNGLYSLENLSRAGTQLHPDRQT